MLAPIMRTLLSSSPRFVRWLAVAGLLASLVGCGDEAPADPDAATMDAGPSCPGAELSCASECVDAQTDPAHCGACDVACAAGEMCEAGACVSSCSGTLTECGGACVDTGSSIEHCGACDAECTPLAGAIPTCSEGECVIACESGYGDCNALAADGCEAQLADDDANCGACGEACIAGTCGEGVCAVTWVYALGSEYNPGAPWEAVVEIRDLASGALAHSIALPGVRASSLAVAPDGLVVYVAASNDEVLVVDVIAETITGRIPLPSVGDLVLSSDGAWLYVSGGDLHRIDTATSAVTTLTVPDNARGIALSPDGATLAAAVWDGTDASAALLLVDTATFDEAQLVPLVGSVAGCTTLPIDVKITSGGRALVWDGNCDALYQVDVAARTQLATVLTGRDSGSFVVGQNLLVYDETTARAYVSKESGELLDIDPIAGTFTARNDLGPQPTMLALTPDRAELYVVTSTSPSVLGRIALADGTFTPSVLTLAHTFFTSQLTIAVAR